MVYHNFYHCPVCHTEWDDIWDCACDDECPECGVEVEAGKFEELEELEEEV